MSIFSELFKSMDKSQDSYDSPFYTHLFERTHAGKQVNNRKALQQIAVYAHVHILLDAITQLPLHDNEKSKC